MKKIYLTIAAIAISLAVSAVPAKRGYHEFVQQDGTPVSLQLVGDEFAHWYEAVDGTIYRENADGTFTATTDSREQMAARRKTSAKYVSAQARRARMEFGKTPNPAPRGIVILANFKDSKMNNSHTQAVFDELCNAANCTVNDGYGSAAAYFKDQSNGVYQPIFDVYGPVTLSRNCNYYGSNDSDGNDEYATDAVIEACILANSQYNDLNFANYDSDNDGYVDFVYVIYAGKGEANGGAATTIWPHNWSVQELVAGGSGYPTTYTKQQTKLDNKYLDNYAMSSELAGDNSLEGIGTLCHEFGHVMGLPDFYETQYGNNYKNAVTPNDWDIMDGGSYNGDGHCPPNYSPWEKYFFGWHTPVNLGNEGQLLTLQANGTAGYQAYQINSSSSLITATTAGECYYIENRQKQGWDAGLPHHGMIIWKVKYNETAWANNAPNADDTSGSPLYTIVSASGTKIGTHINSSETAYVYDGPKNPFPGSQNVTSKTIAGKPLLNIAESNGVVTLTYIEEPAVVVDPFEIAWMANGEEFATTTSTGRVVLPAETPDDCSDGKVFVGWCKIEDYESETTAPTLIAAGQPAEEGDIYYAVFARADGEGGSSISTTDSLTFSTLGKANQTSVNGETIAIGTNSSITFKKANASNEPKYYTSGTSIRLYSGGQCVVSSTSGNISKITFTFGSSDGSNAISANVGSYSNGVWTGDASSVTFTVSGTSGHRRFQSVEVTIGGGAGVSYSDYTTICSGENPEPVYYSIRFFDNGTQIGQTQTVLKGQQAVVPADPVPGCSDYTFVGWWTAELDADNTEAKNWVTSFKAKKDQDYYAIYSKTETVEIVPAVVDDQLTLASTGVSGSNYASWSGVKVNSNAVYAGQSAGSNQSIQLRSNNSNSGIVTTTSGGKIAKVTIVWNNNTVSGRTVDVYGSNSALADPTNMYGNHSLTPLGSIVCGTNTELEVSGDYSYVGVRSNSGALYMTSITFTWNTGGSSSTTYYSSDVECEVTTTIDTFVAPKAMKVIIGGKVVIIRDGEMYDIFGVKL